MTKLEEITEIGQAVIRLSATESDPENRVDEAGLLFPPSKYYLFFRRLSAKYKFKNAVVLGVCGGGDCYHLCQGNPDGKVIGVDIAYDHPEQIAYIRSKYPNFRFLESDSTYAAHNVFRMEGQVDFLFVDTAHDYLTAMREWEAWKPYLAQGAIVCFDDLFRAEMKGVWEALPEPKVRMDLLHDGSPDVGGGFGVLVYGEEWEYDAKLLPLDAPEMGC